LTKYIVWAVKSNKNDSLKHRYKTTLRSKSL